MHKILFLTLVAILNFLLPQPGLIAQENDVTQLEPSAKEMRLPIPVLKTDSSNYFSLADEVARILIRVIQELRLYDFIVGIEIDSTFYRNDEIIARAPVLSFADLQGYSDAIVIVAAEIFQQGVLPEGDENYFSLDDESKIKNADEHEKNYPNNIQTRLYLFAQIINIESGEAYHSLDLEIFHTGGSLKKSKQRALNLFKQRVMYELKGVYWLSSDIIETSDGKLGIPLGTSHQVKKGMVFDLIEPDQIWTVADEDSLVPGGIAGIAMVVDTSADSSGLRILRQWRDHYPGAWLVEHPEPVFGLGMHFYLPRTDSYTNLGVSFHLRPLHTLDYGFGMQLIRVTDSYGDDDYGFGFGGFSTWRFINSSKIDIGGKLDVDLEIPYRKDDNGETVYTALFSTQVGIVAELLFAGKFDFVIHAGYRFAVKTDYWEYSEEEETIPAYWENKAPEVDISGFTISVGFKYLLF